MTKVDEVKVVGDYNWDQMRWHIIAELEKCQSEQDFQNFVKIFLASIGTFKEMKTTRKRLGLKPFTAPEIRQIKEFERRKNGRRR